MGNQFLANIREVDAIVHMVRCFDNDDIIHVAGSVEPVRDIEIINLELILSDLAQIERRITRQRKSAKNDKNAQAEVELLTKISEVLNDGKSVRSIDLSEDELLTNQTPWLTQQQANYLCHQRLGR